MTDTVTLWSYHDQEDKQKSMRSAVLPRPEKAGTFDTTWSYIPAPSDPPFVGDPLTALIIQWVEVACRHARLRQMGSVVVADVVGLSGAWAEGATAEEALAELPAVLTEWVQLKLQDGDNDIPPMEGLHLIVDP